MEVINPAQVFTPRRSDVNSDMYVHRFDHEKKLSRWLDSSMHGFIFGESGNGKTWLYKNVFNEREVEFVVANCAVASNKKSIRKEVYSVCVPRKHAVKTSYKETKNAGINALALKAGVNHEATYQVLEDDLLLVAFESLSSKANGKLSIIVLDNVETIFDNDELMNELADIIILLDDERYSKHNIKFLLVGVPCGVVEYFSKSKNRSSVSNRISELPAVNGFSLAETTKIISKGFNDILNYGFSSQVITGLAGNVFDITLGVPQRVHEYCLSLCYALEDSEGYPNKKALDTAGKEWLDQGLRESYSVIDQHFSNSRQIRRKQVLFIIGWMRVYQFTTSEVGRELRSTFPEDSIESDSGVGAILSSLTKGESPILKKNNINNSYSFCDPRHIMCLRLILKKTDIGDVEKVNFAVG